MFEWLNALEQIIGYMLISSLLLTIVISLDVPYQQSDDTNKNDGLDMSSLSPSVLFLPKNVYGHARISNVGISHHHTSSPVIESKEPLCDERLESARQDSFSLLVIDE